jgi:histidine triad (HIT) family protein
MSCLFCSFADGSIPVDRVAENDRAFAINDINPVAPTHLLIIPKKHFENAAQVSAADPESIVDIFRLVEEIARSQGLDGYRTIFNTGASAGQSVFHAHLHMIAGRPLTWPPG